MNSMKISIVCAVAAGFVFAAPSAVADGGAALLISWAAFCAELIPDTSRVNRVAWFNDARFGMFIHWGIY